MNDAVDGRFADEPESQARDRDPELTGRHAAVQVGGSVQKRGRAGYALIH